MKAMMLTAINQPLELVDRNIPEPKSNEVLVKVLACGVCRTDLHLIDGELPDTHVPIIPGHEIVGKVVKKGANVSLDTNQLVGIPWLGWTCGSCVFCREKMENLCDRARFTGYQLDGGYCEYTVADHRYCLPLDISIDPAKYAPLLCAGLIGYRSWKKALSIKGPVQKIGIYGFGAAAHILSQIITFQDRFFYAFTRPEDEVTQKFAYQLGAKWAGSSDMTPPDQLDAAIIFAPAGDLVPQALKAIRKGGIVVCGGIHMTDIPSFPYEHLWGEKKICSVANLARQDGIEFLEIAKQAGIEAHIKEYALSEANMALTHVRKGKLNGAAVLVM